MNYETTERDTLHAAIMNLPADPKVLAQMEGSPKGFYLLGHRDARHAAAELVSAWQARASAATQAEPEPNTEQSNCHSAANGNEAPCGATAVEAAPTASNLTLAVIGREHFGNPIPREWYAAARALLANLPPAKETK